MSGDPRPASTAKFRSTWWQVILLPTAECNVACDYCFGNIFREPDLTRMLNDSPARRKFVERPARLVEDEDCLECRFLSICHGGCPVRTFAALGTINSKDPYCEVYKTIFAKAEQVGQKRRRLASAPAGR